MIFVFYHDDLDGKMSAAIVNSTIPRDLKFVPIDYSDDFAIVGKTQMKVKDVLVNRGDSIVFLDFTPSNFKEIVKAMGSRNIVWIDHHETALDANKELDEILDGIRDKRYAAATLTCWYFMKRGKRGSACPDLIDAVSRCDIEENPKESDLAIHYGCQPLNIYALSYLLEYPHNIENVRLSGYAIMKYLRFLANSIQEKYGVSQKFFKYKTLFINTKISARMFDASSHDVLVTYVFNGKKFELGLFSTGHGKLLNLNKIALKFGGGGHPNAAGCYVDVETMMKMLQGDYAEKEV